MEVEREKRESFYFCICMKLVCRDCLWPCAWLVVVLSDSCHIQLLNYWLRTSNINHEPPPGHGSTYIKKDDFSGKNNFNFPKSFDILKKKTNSIITTTPLEIVHVYLLMNSSVDRNMNKESKLKLLLQWTIDKWGMPAMGSKYIYVCAICISTTHIFTIKSSSSH